MNTKHRNSKRLSQVINAAMLFGDEFSLMSPKQREELKQTQEMIKNKEKNMTWKE